MIGAEVSMCERGKTPLGKRVGSRRTARQQHRAAGSPGGAPHGAREPKFLGMWGASSFWLVCAATRCPAFKCSNMEMTHSMLRWAAHCIGTRTRAKTLGKR